VILLLGGSGMLGSALARRLAVDGRECVAASRQQLDLMLPDSIATALESIAPDAVINAAAFTDVNRAELPECRREVFGVNADGPAALARACAARGAKLVHISTDYVFDGADKTPYLEGAATGPVQVYGESKLAGERAVLASAASALVVRASTLYGPGRIARPHYIDAIREQLRTRDVLEVVELPVASPTLTLDLAEGVVRLLDVGAGGIVHVANEGACSRLELTRAVVELSGRAERVEVRVRAAGTSGPSRPSYSALSTARFESLTGRRLRGWRQALAEYLAPEGNSRTRP
jgi:dTDP-4-dehydrorhamnose reductase